MRLPVLSLPLFTLPLQPQLLQPLTTNRIYITGDTLLIPELSSIPERYPNIDLMLIHLGGTTIPGPSAPLVMVTMDAEQGVKLVRMVGADLTIPIHYE